MFISVLGLVYKEEFQKENLSSQEMARLYTDANNLFLPGLLKTKAGCCVSMPMLYLTLGRALGFPLYLVHIGKHSFVRWQDEYFKMNIETTLQHQVSITPEDDLYLETEGLTRKDIEGTSYLKNLSDTEVLGKLYFIRSCYYHVKQENKKAVADAQKALELCPNTPHMEKYCREIS